MIKREWSAESNGTLPHLFIPSKTATFVPAFAVKDLMVMMNKIKLILQAILQSIKYVTINLSK